MRDGCFERRLSRGPLDVEVNPLPVFSRFGKLVDAILRNVEPVADADLLAEILVELIDTVDMNHGSMPAITRSVWYREAVAPRSPGLSLRLPWGSEPQDASTATRLRQKSRNLNVLGQRIRALGRNRVAVETFCALFPGVAEVATLGFEAQPLRGTAPAQRCSDTNSILQILKYRRCTLTTTDAHRHHAVT